MTGSRRTMLYGALLATLAGSQLLVSCADDDDEDIVPSIVNGQITGAHSDTLDGRALFGVTINTAADADGMALVLGDSGEARIVLVSSNTPKPPARTYQIVGPGFSVGTDTVWSGSISIPVAGGIEYYQISGGTITLTASTHKVVSGNFAFQAERTIPPAAAQVSVTGTFVAFQIPQN